MDIQHMPVKPLLSTISIIIVEYILEILFVKYFFKIFHLGPLPLTLMGPDRKPGPIFTSEKTLNPHRFLNKYVSGYLCGFFAGQEHSAESRTHARDTKNSGHAHTAGNQPGVNLPGVLHNQVF